MIGSFNISTLFNSGDVQCVAQNNKWREHRHYGILVKGANVRNFDNERGEEFCWGIFWKRQR